MGQYMLSELQMSATSLFEAKDKILSASIQAPFLFFDWKFLSYCAYIIFLFSLFLVLNSYCIIYLIAPSLFYCIFLSYITICNIFSCPWHLSAVRQTTTFPTALANYLLYSRKKNDEKFLQKELLPQNTQTYNLWHFFSQSWPISPPHSIFFWNFNHRVYLFLYFDFEFHNFSLLPFIFAFSCGRC